VEQARAQLLDQSRQAFTNALSPVTPGQWEQESGCGQWTVGDLIAHVIAAMTMYVALLDGATTTEAIAKVKSVTTSPASAFSDFVQAADALQARLASPEAVTRIARHPAGDMTGGELAGFAMLECILHGWDLSRATGQDTFIDPELATAIYEGILPDAERLRHRGAFGPAIPVSADAPMADRLLALLGRTP
jgi:uncharacterized protein (TIGR03086 family)